MSDARQAGDLFADFLQMPGLYDKPGFGEAIWSSSDGKRIYGAWLPTEDREKNAQDFEELKRRKIVARRISMPPRLDARAITFVVSVSPSNVLWHDDIAWVAPAMPRDDAQVSCSGRPALVWFPEEFKEDFKSDLEVIASEKAAYAAPDGQELRLTRKNSADPNNQLLDMVRLLEKRYKALDIKTRRMEFTWRGIKQANLLAFIPGSLPFGENKPVVMADHIDTAYAEDIYRDSKRRVSVPGADDNGTAVAALLRAADRLKDMKPLHDIWLLHLTGEEFPADDLGARFFIEQMLKEGRDLGGVVILDMIGYNVRGNRSFQVNPGQSRASIEMALTALSAAKSVAPTLEANLLPRYDSKSYLYNTDGLIFDQQGFPVVLFNEDMNRFNLNRKGYHDTQDVVSNIDFDYATAIVKVAIETVAELAMKQ